VAEWIIRRRPAPPARTAPAVVSHLHWAQLEGSGLPSATTLRSSAGMHEAQHAWNTRINPPDRDQGAL